MCKVSGSQPGFQHFYSNFMACLGIKYISENRRQNISMKSGTSIWIVYCKETCGENESGCIDGCSEGGTLYWCRSSEDTSSWTMFFKGGPDESHGCRRCENAYWTCPDRETNSDYKILSPSPSSPHPFILSQMDVSTYQRPICVFWWFHVSLITSKPYTVSFSRPSPTILPTWEPYSHFLIIYILPTNFI